MRFRKIVAGVINLFLGGMLIYHDNGVLTRFSGIALIYAGIEILIGLT